MTGAWGDDMVDMDRDEDESSQGTHRKPVKDYDKFLLRLPDGLREEIKSAASKSGRSMNEEMVKRLLAQSGKERRHNAHRDAFAGQALAGFCANPAIFAANDRNGWDLVNCTEPQLAQVAYRIAGEMIAAREGGAE